MESLIHQAQSANPDSDTPDVKVNPEKPQKSQEALRAIFKARFKAYEAPLEQQYAEYDKAQKDGIFKDKDDESEGSGEARKVAMQKEMTILINRAQAIRARLDSKEPLPQFQEELQASYTRPDGTKETITFNLEKSIQEFTKLYTDTGIDIPDDFAQTIQDIWERNQSEIQQAIEQNGFDDILIIPPTPNLPELSEKMKMENGYILEVDFKQGGGFTGAKSNNVEKPRILLVHNTQNLKDRPELAQTLNTFGKDVKQEEALTLEDYIIFQRKYFEKYQKHLDEDGWTWLATKAGTRLVSSYWAPGNHKLGVCAFGLDGRSSGLGVRPTRCFT